MADDFHVKGRVSVDGSSLSRAADSIKTGLGRAFGNVAGSFRGMLLSMFSAGAITALIGNSLRKAAETARDAAKSGLTTEEYSTLDRLAERTGVSVEELAKKYIKAKENGGEFAGTVQKAMKELLDDGLIPSTQQTEAMATAMSKLMDFASKASVTVGDIVSKLNSKVEQHGVLGALMQSATDTGTLLLANVQEKLADLVVSQYAEGENAPFIKNLRNEAFLNRMKAYGIGTGALPLPPKSDDKKGEDNKKAEDLITSDAAADFRKNAIGVGAKSQAMAVSALTQIGGYQTRGQNFASAQEYQLKLLNRQVGDLVALTKKGLQ